MIKKIKVWIALFAICLFWMSPVYAEIDLNTCLSLPVFASEINSDLQSAVFIDGFDKIRARELWYGFVIGIEGAKSCIEAEEFAMQTQLEIKKELGYEGL